MIGQKYKYPKGKAIFTLKSIGRFVYRFECGHVVTDCVFADLILCNPQLKLF